MNAVNETGTDSGSGPVIMRVIIIATGALTLISLVIMAVDSRRLRQLPAELRTAAAGAAKHHPVRAHAHRYPPRHRLSWAVGWVGMVLIVFIAVICFPGVVDGVGYLEGAGKSATFTGQSYDQSCGNFHTQCETVTDGVLTRNGVSVSTTWPAQVPLGQPAAGRRRGAGRGAVRPDGPQLAAVSPTAGLRPGARLAAVAQVGRGAWLVGDLVEDGGAAGAGRRLGEETDPGAGRLAEREVTQQAPPCAVV